MTRPMESKENVDLLILGAGSGAFAAAIRGAEAGARIMMVERDLMGGSCVNVGCVPSKTLIRAVDLLHLARHHPFDGIPQADSSVDVAALVAQKAELVERLRESKYRDVLAAYPSVEYVEGEARFIDDHTVAVARPGAGPRRIEADRIVIATGASPWVPMIPGFDEVGYWTNVEALSATEVPETLMVAGGGPVGLEMAQLFARLGSRVTLVAPVLLPDTDPEVGETIREAFEAEGIEVIEGHRVTALARSADGARWAARSAGAEKTGTAARILMATGRRANTGALDLAAAGVEADERGFVEVDARLRTSRPHIYAVGDCTTLPMFVYVAAKAGTVAAENALETADRALDLSSVPSVVFTDPQVAWVGSTETDALARGEAVEARVLPMAEVPRALVNRDPRGFVKLVAREGIRTILGAQVVSPSAGETIQTAVLAVKHGLSVGEFADTFFPYLTEVEGLKLAAQTFTKSMEKLSCCAG